MHLEAERRPDEIERLNDLMRQMGKFLEGWDLDDAMRVAAVTMVGAIVQKPNSMAEKIEAFERLVEWMRDMLTRPDGLEKMYYQ